MIRKQLAVWVIAAVVSYTISDHQVFSRIFMPLGVVACLAFLYQYTQVKYSEYLLFFTISIASLFGLTEALTGSHAETSHVLLFGLSFYTTSIAYLIATKSFSTSKIWSVSNPLLLSTGPIALYCKSIFHKKMKERIKYYVPFMIIGIFMFRVVASPLTEFFFLVENTDLLSSLLFAVIFEVFVYMNFCGLSLLIYGLFGVLGYRIPLNFKQPFSSHNMVEYWRAWHISLSHVLKLLFYQPLRARAPLFTALMGVFLASAMWHGVTLNFLLWGTFHTVFIWLTIRLLQRGHKFLCFVLMPIAIVVGRLIFADSNTERLIEKLVFSFEGFDGVHSLLDVTPQAQIALFFGILMILVEFMFRHAKVMRKRNYKYLRTPFALSILCIFGALFISNVGLDYAVYGQR